MGRRLRLDGLKSITSNLPVNRFGIQPVGWRRRSAGAIAAQTASVPLIARNRTSFGLGWRLGSDGIDQISNKDC
jgi:hypothetical protein